MEIGTKARTETTRQRALLTLTTRTKNKDECGGAGGVQERGRGRGRILEKKMYVSVCKIESLPFFLFFKKGEGGNE